MPVFEYTPYDLQNPLGSNSLSPRAAYFQRALYKQKIYPGDLFAPLDTWYDKTYYGRVDRTQNTIIPDVSKLAVIKSATTPTLVALNFVVDAFEDFVAHMQSARSMGVLRSPSSAHPRVNNKIVDPRAYRAYIDPATFYDNHLQSVHNAFVDNLDGTLLDKITNFETYTDWFINYLKSTAGTLPLTKTNYLLTNFVDMMYSGLSISIDGASAADDEYKYDNYISDANFKFYARVAKKFGFTVNKNIPWMLTADLFSDAILKYIGRYDDVLGNPITKYTFFEELYVWTFLGDIDTIKSFIVSSYNSFVEIFPLHQTKIFEPYCDKYTVETAVRPIVTPDPTSTTGYPDLVESVLTDKKMVDLYLYLRSTEAKTPIRMCKQLRDDIYNMYNWGDGGNGYYSRLQLAAARINSIYKNFIYPGSAELLDPHGRHYRKLF